MAAVRQIGVTLDRPEDFPDFYEQTLPGIYGYFLHRCGGRVAVAEDLTQETYLAAAREIARRQSVDGAVRWLYGIARHKLIDYYRDEERIQARSVAWYDGIEDELATTPGDMVGSGLGDYLIELLDLLPPSQRATLVLRYGDGLSVPDVAAALGKSVHAVESLLARGRTSLRRWLVETNYE